MSIDRKRSVDLDKMSIETIDQIGIELNKKINNFMDQTKEQRDLINKQLEELNIILKVYSLQLRVGYELITN